MARIFVDYVPDKIIIKELKLCHAYDEALRNGVPAHERPALPLQPKSAASKRLAGTALHLTNYIFLNLSEMLGLVNAVKWLAGSRIRTDEYSAEPMSCGLHSAYTKYGLACLARGEVTLAIQSLIYS